MVEILQMREDMWASTAARVKTLQKVYPFGPGADEFMTYGVEDYNHKCTGSYPLPERQVKMYVCFQLNTYVPAQSFPGG
jgi:hypothetical protein